MNKKVISQEELNKEKKVFIVGIVIVMILLSITYVGFVNSKKSCDIAYEIWYNYTKDMSNQEYVDFKTMCQVYNQFP